MSPELSKASQDAIDAARQGERYAEILAVVAAVQQATPQHQQACDCRQQPVKPRRSAGELAVIGAGVCACVGVATAALLAVALAAVAVGVSAVVLLILVRELRRR
ncbi:hypothetical protein ACFY2M_21605 [Streptomyces sp. NPDC001276]|uniref:hypothetical protein n=1 Tax=Streptomyces sp. NPDC001276 TaxID=3364555 RepID=UPI0036AC3FC2